MNTATLTGYVGRGEYRQAAERMTVGGEAWALLRNGNHLRVCAKCVGTGHIEHYAGIYGGVCFDCNGVGVTGKAFASVEAIEKDAARRAKARATAAARRERKAAEKATEALAARDEWATANPVLAAALAKVRALPHTDDRQYGPLDDLARKAGHGPLTEKQAAFAETLLAERAEAEAVRAGQRYAGEVDGKVTVTGTVRVSYYLPPENYGWAGRVLVVIEGTGDDAGVTVKVVSAAEGIFALEVGDAVTVTGTVKAHDEFNGTPQTVLVRPKVTTA